MLLAEKLCQGVVTYGAGKNGSRDRQADRILTGKYTGTAVMLGLLAFVFWLTIVGANFLSDGLTRLFGLGEAALWRLCQVLPGWLRGILVQGAWRTTAWVVAVMLPPMAIFFPLFTLLEDVGYLPRIAFNLDKPFHRCKACGKQALTMCMGFGCNAAGVVGCRIIDSPRERLLAILTNSLVPCNGRFPLLITLVTLFFAGGSSLLQAAIMTAAVAAAVGATLGVTALLSATVLRGQSSAFALELPSYRVPQVGKVLVRSALDRTLFVLGRAAAVAAPAGMVLWILANCRTGGGTLLTCLARALEPMGTFLGLDGVLLLAFLLGLPANEIVLPIALMAYLSQSSLQGLGESGRPEGCASGQRLVHEKGSLHSDFHSLPLALLHNAAYGLQGDKQPSVDGLGGDPPDGFGGNTLQSGCGNVGLRRGYSRPYWARICRMASGRSRKNFRLLSVFL